MKIRIYYGSLAAFTEKLPDNFDSIVDLAIRDDEKHRKLNLMMDENIPLRSCPITKMLLLFRMTIRH